MAEADKTVFLSYRRDVSWAMAHLVRNDLVAHGFDVFMDVHGIDTGEFERVIMRQIAARTHFVLLLEPRSLDRVGEPDDWLRRELALCPAGGAQRGAPSRGGRPDTAGCKPAGRPRPPYGVQRRLRAARVLRRGHAETA